MAPRKDSPPRRDDHNNEGTRNRQLLNAHTGAGVNANRLAALRGRGGSSHTIGTSSRGTSGNQPRNQRRAPVSTPGRRLAERLDFEDNRHRQVQEADSDDATPDTQHARSEQQTSIDVSTHETQASNVGTPQRHQRSALTSTPHTTTTTPITPRPQPRPTINVFNPFTHFDRTPVNTTALSFLISPPPLPRAPAAVAAPRGAQHDDTAAVKKAFTNPKLRAIMSNKRYPTQRKKALAERPVLKVGLKKEYK